MRLVSAADMRALDARTIAQGTPGLVLMERAGRAAARAARARLGRRRGPVVVACGRGNNGGDGFVIARHLAMRGYDVSVDLLGEPAGLSPDAGVNYAIVAKMGLAVRPLNGSRALTQAVSRWRRSAVVVDALLGTGFAGEVREPLAGVIRRINELKSPLIVAVDVPSGLNADTGEPGGVAVRADRTVTFLAEKAGLGRRAAKTYAGKVTVVDIGAPLSLILSKLA
jgi:hydroxyethylthiazole kinase-like uncharacterized protein yjeF